MIIGVHSIILYYEFFYQKKYNSPKYRFKPPSEALSKIGDFLKKLDQQYDLNTLGKKFLSTYFLFQFNRTHNQVFNRFASRFQNGDLKVGGRIQIYDIIGKQAFKYWIDRNIKFDFILEQCDFLKEHKISLLELNQLLETREVKKVILQSEEIEKKRFFNTLKGWVNCIRNTSLYHHQSLSCIVCNYKIDCKILLENNYPHIYRERSYGK